MSRNPLLRFWFNLLFWSFGRGTWQYDLLCGSIIAFMFLAPTHAFFSGVEKNPDDPSQRIVGLRKVTSDSYLLLILDRRNRHADEELEKRWTEFDRKTGHRFAKRAFYDENDRKLGYILAPP